MPIHTRCNGLIGLLSGAALLCAAAPATAAADVTTLISDPAVLGELDRNNAAPLSMVSLFRTIHARQKLAMPSVAAAGPTRASELAKFSDSYGQFAATLSADIGRVVAEMGIDWEKEILKTYDSRSARTEAGKMLRFNGNVTRIFNEKWLSSGDGLFPLAGVVNRIDRRDFDPGHCGEVRFVYRLAYDVKLNGKTYASRMPFTVNMVFSYGDDGKRCQDVAALWRSDGAAAETPAATAQRLLRGPLDVARLSFKQMEVNAQIARFPSDLESTMNRKFAGQAIYLMRIFAFRDGKFQPVKLENTPDVQAILGDPSKQKQLRDYLASHAAEIDDGVFQLPEELATDVALSFSTAGSARLANRPFDLLIDKAQAEQIARAFAKPARFAQSGAGLLERLNTSTCMGCHQSSSTAGFHFLGADRTDFGGDAAAIKVAIDGNQLQLPFSPHVDAELVRRKDYVERVARGEAPNTFRPHPSAPAAAWDKAAPAFAAAFDNMPCPLGTDLAAPAKWSCSAARHLTCQPVVTNASASSGLGQCLPDAANIHAGLSCRTDAIEDSTARRDRTLLSFNLRAFNDRVKKEDLIYKVPEGTLRGYDYNCRPTRLGVPLGRITRPCTPDELKLATIQPGKSPEEICAIVGGKGFEQMAKGYFDSEAFAVSVGRGLLNTCSPSRFCREDYICQQMPDLLTRGKFSVSAQAIDTLKSQKIGFCTPTYFVYQLRLDGHPNPR